MLPSDAELILKEFEKQLKKYSTRTLNISPNEKVVIIEDTLVLYLGILNYYEYWLRKKIYKPNDVNVYIIELTYNDIDFDYKIKELSNFSQNITKEEYPGLYFLKFFRVKQKNIIHMANSPVGEVITEPDISHEIANKLPELKLRERQASWAGITYYFIIIEVTGTTGEIGLGVFSTTKKPYSYMNAHCQQWIKKGFQSGNSDAVGENFEKALLSWQHQNLKRKFILENYLKYFFIEKNLKDKNKLWKIKWEILENAQKGLYDNIERNTYIRPSNRWKSEELVYKYVKKIYKDYKVIYQHRPFFLVSSTGGQMSYDIFITKLNIAIEYQGKQHFEPIDFFGGKEAYEKTIERDRLKKEISEQNGIKLIYINHWENITIDFIKKKIEEVIGKEWKCDKCGHIADELTSQALPKG